MPAPAPGSVSERTAIPMMIRNNSGIITFENFSMPFLTPRMTIRPDSKRNIVWQTSGCQDDAAKSEKMEESAALSPPRVKSKRKALKRYSMPQPPTTE